MRILIILLLSIGTANSAYLLKAIDGDTARIIDKEKIITLRLFGIDAPEFLQDYGKNSRNFLEDTLEEIKFDVVYTGGVTYGRRVGTIFYKNKDGKNINFCIESVSTGNSWAYKQYITKNKVVKYIAAENTSRAKGLGLWALPNPIPPWEWRKNKIKKLAMEVKV